MFKVKERENGTPYTTLSDNAPAWLVEAVHAAHNGDMPNDWIYEQCAQVYNELARGYLTDNEETLHNYVDSSVDVYTRSLFTWAADMCLTDTYLQASEMAQDMHNPANVEETFKTIQYFAIESIARTMFAAYQENQDVDS